MIAGIPYTWGSNFYGELGNIDLVTNIAARGDFVLALQNDHTVWVWGNLRKR